MLKGALHRVHTEWQLSIFGVHSIMMEKSAWLVRVGGARPPPFTLCIIITYKFAVYDLAERADILPLTEYIVVEMSICRIRTIPSPQSIISAEKRRVRAAQGRVARQNSLANLQKPC